MIYDCFVFFNELDLLEIRLNELYDVVDRFVIIEGENTFQGKPKSLYYLENKERYSKFEDKIIHIIIPKEKLNNTNAWDNERLSFNTCFEIENLKDEDILMVSALDEIPSNNSVKTAINKTPCHVELHACFFYLNTNYFHNMSTNWYGTIIYKVSELKEIISDDKLPDIYDIKQIHQYKTNTSIRGGWHFSFVGDGKNAMEKVNAYSHSEYNYLDENFYTYMRENLLDPFNRGNFCQFYRLLNKEELPEYVQNNLEKFKNYIK